jgi:MFS family permease
MYGGGFATIPAYLADIFGTQMVGAIHGRLLTAWAAAGIFGPTIVNYLREYQLGLGIPVHKVYDLTTYVLSGLLLIGLICNALVKPVHRKHHMTEKQLEGERKNSHEIPYETDLTPAEELDKPTHPIVVILAWLAVCIPLAWGVWMTFVKILPIL